MAGAGLDADLAQAAAAAEMLVEAVQDVLSSSTVLLYLPTSPISPPIEIVTPCGSIWRPAWPAQPSRVKFWNCWSASVSGSSVTRVQVSMSMLP